MATVARPAWSTLSVIFRESGRSPLSLSPSLVLSTSSEGKPGFTYDFKITLQSFAAFKKTLCNITLDFLISLSLAGSSRSLLSINFYEASTCVSSFRRFSIKQLDRESVCGMLELDLFKCRSSRGKSKELEFLRIACLLSGNNPVIFERTRMRLNLDFGQWNEIPAELTFYVDFLRTKIATPLCSQRDTLYTPDKVAHRVRPAFSATTS